MTDCSEPPVAVMLGQDEDVDGVVAIAACQAHRNDGLGWFDHPESVEIVDGSDWREGAGGLWLAALAAFAVWWLRR